MPRLIVTAPALKDLERLRDFLAGKNQAAAERAKKAILEHLEKARRNPLLYRPVPDRPGEREIIIAFGSYGYIARYLYDQSMDSVVILRIWHLRENRT